MFHGVKCYFIYNIAWYKQKTCDRLLNETYELAVRSGSLFLFLTRLGDFFFDMKKNFVRSMVVFHDYSCEKQLKIKNPQVQTSLFASSRSSVTIYSICTYHPRRLIK